jgi:methylenetetrahydrofolate reductase (NADPH)
MTQRTIDFSFEFFPPKTDEGRAKLFATYEKLVALKPRYFSVTFGAGGSTRDGTLETVSEIARRGSEAAPHLSCIGATRAGVDELLEMYRARGIRRIVALRGDLPSGMVEIGEFRYASDLIAHIRKSTGDWFHIEAAAYPEVHPQAKSPRDDLLNFKRKIDAGANAGITQYFYNADAYFRFRDECTAAGVNVPIAVGVMPIANFSQLARFSDACGAEIPRWMRMKLQSFGDDRESIQAFGLDVVAAMCERLLAGGAPGIHFYTLNMAGLSVELCQRLNLGAR